MRSKIRNWFTCFWQGHTYYQLIWPGFGVAPHDVYKCRVCGSYDIRGRSHNGKES